MNCTLGVGVGAGVLFAGEAINTLILFGASKFFSWYDEVHFIQPLGFRRLHQQALQLRPRNHLFWRTLRLSRSGAR